jgi:hypothetical protein
MLMLGILVSFLESIRWRQGADMVSGCEAALGGCRVENEIVDIGAGDLSATPCKMQGKMAEGQRAKEYKLLGFERVYNW